VVKWEFRRVTVHRRWYLLLTGFDFEIHAAKVIGNDAVFYAGPRLIRNSYIETKSAHNFLILKAASLAWARTTNSTRY
jgi:hypothetical protein